MHVRSVSTGALRSVGCDEPPECESPCFSTGGPLLRGYTPLRPKNLFTVGPRQGSTLRPKAAIELKRSRWQRAMTS